MFVTNTQHVTLRNLHTTEHLCDEDKGCDKPNRSEQHRQRHAEDKQIPRQLRHHHETVQLDHVSQVIEREEESVDAGGRRSRKTDPPPMIVLRAENRIDNDDGNLSGRDHDDDEDDEQEPEEIVSLSHPQRRQEEEELDEHDAERNDASDQNHRQRAQIPRLRRDLARNGGGGDGWLEERMRERTIGSEDHERERETDPDEDELDEGPQRNHGDAVLRGREHLLEEENDEEGDCVRREERKLLGSAEAVVAMRRLICLPSKDT